MSVENVRGQIRKFLRSPHSDVLCIRGNWGTGKTWTWLDELKRAASDKDGLSKSKYAYVSLFGQNSRRGAAFHELASGERHIHPITGRLSSFGLVRITR